MSPSVLVLHASERGSTREVAEFVADALRGQGLAVEMHAAAQAPDPSAYAAVVLGGALYTGRLHRDARRYLRRHRAALAERPVAVFAMGPGTLEPDDVAGSRKQLDAALAKVPEVRPAAVAIFGGVVDPHKLRFPFNRMEAVDARDWPAIGEWARALPVALGLVAQPAS